MTAVAEGFAPVVRQAIAQATEPLLARIAVLEQRESTPGERGPAGEKGLDGAPGKDAPAPDTDVIAMKVAALLPVPRDGREGAPGKDAPSMDLVALAKMVVDLIPTPKDGANGRDGTDVDMGAVKAMVTEAVAAIPVPKDGTNGQDGKDGTSVDPAFVSAEIAKAVAAIPVPKDGAPGQDGQDGLTFSIEDLMTASFDGERTTTLVFGRGEKRLEVPMRFQVPLYFDVWSTAKSYQAGDCVTYGGSMWIAKADTTERPGDGATSWRLCVKAGREGKSVAGPVGPRGPQGERGPAKW